MTLAAAVTAARKAADSLQTDTCTITRAGAVTRVLDEETGRYTVVPAEIYHGPCRVKNYRQNNDRIVQAGETAVSLWPFVVAVPITVTDLKVDDVITVTASLLDPALPGLQLRVRDVVHGSQISARRLGCEVNAG